MKRFRVHTVRKPTLWLHALDPLEPLKGDYVRSEWRRNEHEATVFESNMYAFQVAQNSPRTFFNRPTRPFEVERLPDKENT